MKKVTGFKGFDKDMKCRGMQYEENKTFEIEGDVEICERGLHFCKMPLDVFNYYPPVPEVIYSEVEAEGNVIEKIDKCATNKLKIKSKISISEMFKLHFDMIMDKVKKSKDTTSTAGEYAHANTVGNYAHANTAGYKAHANTAGDYAHASTAGYEAHANTAGDYAHANTAGDEAYANTAGYKAHANTAGYEAHASTAGDEAHANTAGDDSIACSLGFEGKSSAKKGWIVIVDWRVNNDNYNRYIHEIHHAKVGQKILGTVIEPDKKYWFENGKLKSEKI